MKKFSARKQIIIALIGAVLIHVALILFCAVAIPAMYPPDRPGGQLPPPLQLTIERERTPEPELVPAQQQTPPPYAKTLDRQHSDVAPDDPAFQSHQNTLAASELPPQNNDRTAATQDGREMPFFEFDTQDYTAGDKASDSAGRRAPPPSENSPQTQQSPPPKPERQAATARAQQSPPPEFRTEASPPPAPTPLARAEPQEFAMLAPQPSPTPPEQVKPQVDPPRPQPLAVVRPRAQPPAPPVRPGDPGYKPQTTRAKIVGGITNRGPSSPAALDTPLGRYQKVVQDAIGTRWYFYVQRQADVIPIGLVRFKFSVNSAGKIKNIRVLEGDSTGTLATVTMSALLEATIPPMPPDLVSALPDHQLDYDSFTFAHL